MAATHAIRPADPVLSLPQRSVQAVTLPLFGTWEALESHVPAHVALTLTTTEVLLPTVSTALMSTAPLVLQRRSALVATQGIILQGHPVRPVILLVSHALAHQQRVHLVYLHCT